MNLKWSKTKRHNDRKTLRQKDNKKDSDCTQANSNELRWTTIKLRQTKTERHNDRKTKRQ